MVMLLGGDQIAVTAQGRALIASLDLSSGVELARVARRDSSGAAQRIRLRKTCIRSWMDQESKCDPDITTQLIVPGAGLSPLALDWCCDHADCRAIELDYEHMDAKRGLINQCAQHSIASRIICSHCDLRQIDDTKHILTNSGWRSERPALWILEGLSYYISFDELCALIRLALGGHERSRVIMEFSGPRDELTQSARLATEAYHQFIGTLLGGGDLTITDIDAVVANTGTRLDRLVHPAQIEEQFHLERFFAGPRESAMRIAMLAPSLVESHS